MAVLRICDKCGADVSKDNLYRIKPVQVVGDDGCWEVGLKKQSTLDLCGRCVRHLMHLADMSEPKKGD